MPAAPVPETSSAAGKEQREMIRDLVFGAALFGLVAFAGALIFGTIDGIHLWRVLWFAAVAGHGTGYRARMRRAEIERRQRYG